MNSSLGYCLIFLVCGKFEIIFKIYIIFITWRLAITTILLKRNRFSVEREISLDTFIQCVQKQKPIAKSNLSSFPPIRVAVQYRELETDLFLVSSHCLACGRADCCAGEPGLVSRHLFLINPRIANNYQSRLPELHTLNCKPPSTDSNRPSNARK